MKNILLYSKYTNGHRKDYINFIGKTFLGERVGLIEIMFSKKMTLFLMIEENFLIFSLIAIWRSALGRRTAGILFRAKPLATTNTFRIILKRNLLFILKSIKTIKIISIVPNYAVKKLDKYISEWIYDFQFWDLDDKIKRKYYQLHINKNNNRFDYLNCRDKKVIISIGMQNQEKGTERFMEIFEDQEINRDWVFICAGVFNHKNKYKIEKFKKIGGIIIDRYITEDELIELFAFTDLVWSMYSKGYDQSSGVFGRCLQLGIPTVIRDDSIIAAISNKLNINSLLVNDNNVVEIIRNYDISKQTRSSPEKIDEKLISFIRNQSCLKLANIIDTK